MCRRDRDLDRRDARTKSLKQNLISREAAWLKLQKLLDSQLQKTIRDCKADRTDDNRSPVIDLGGSSLQHASAGHGNRQIDEETAMDAEMQEGELSLRRTRTPRRRSRRISASAFKQKRRRSDGNDSSVTEDESGGCSPKKVRRCVL